AIMDLASLASVRASAENGHAPASRRVHAELLRGWHPEWKNVPQPPPSGMYLAARRAASTSGSAITGQCWLELETPKETRMRSHHRRDDQGRLADKNILITGGNSGIGLAAAQEFDREGARVAICGLNEGSLQAAKETLGAGSLAVRADVSNL